MSASDSHQFIHSVLGPHIYLKMKYSPHFCTIVIDYDKISVLFNRNPAQCSFESATFSSHVNCASCQSDKNQSGALAHIWQSIWFEP